MLTHAGQVTEIRLDGSKRAAWIACPKEAIPQPGQYVSAWSPQDQETALSSVLFSAENTDVGFLAVPPVPHNWEPGTSLILRGPLGRGFQLPATARRLALIALGIACWPGPPLVGMLTYSIVVILYLAYLSLAVGVTGVLLWPAVALHLVLTILLGRVWLATEVR